MDTCCSVIRKIGSLKNISSKTPYLSVRTRKLTAIIGWFPVQTVLVPNQPDPGLYSYRCRLAIFAKGGRLSRKPVHQLRSSVSENSHSGNTPNPDNRRDSGAWSPKVQSGRAYVPVQQPIWTLAERLLPGRCCPNRGTRTGPRPCGHPFHAIRFRHSRQAR